MIGESNLTSNSPRISLTTNHFSTLRVLFARLRTGAASSPVSFALRKISIFAPVFYCTVKKQGIYPTGKHYEIDQVPGYLVP